MAGTIFGNRSRSVTGAFIALSGNLYKSFCGQQTALRGAQRGPRADLPLRLVQQRPLRLRAARLAEQLRAATVRVKLLDGIQNLMPCGVGSQFQLEYSTLLDAYKKNELIPETGLGLFTLSAIPIDRPEPAEALRANTVWSFGLRPRAILLSSVQLDRFRNGLPLRAGNRSPGRARRLLRPREHWRCSAGRPRIGDRRRRQPGPVRCRRTQPSAPRQPARLRNWCEADIVRGTEELQRIVGKADGLQKTAQPLGNARHFSNVLFNVMRGGIFMDGYTLDPDDLRAFVRHANKEVAARHAAFFAQLGQASTCSRTAGAGGRQPATANSSGSAGNTCR